MPWYRVTKTINGRKYDYWQRTYRVAGSVKTENKYIGPNANPPRMPSLKTVMVNKSERHQQLRKQYDAGTITKLQYLESLAAKTEPPHVHEFVWQMQLDEDGNTIKQCACGEISEVERPKRLAKLTADDIPW